MSPDHPMRLMLLRLLERRPGVTLSRLAAASGTTKGNLLYHVRVLQRGSRVWLERDGGCFRVFPGPRPSAEEAGRLVRAASLDALDVRLLVTIGSGRRPREVRRAFPGLPYSTFGNRIAGLVRRGFLVRGEVGGHLAYVPAAGSPEVAPRSSVRALDELDLRVLAAVGQGCCQKAVKLALSGVPGSTVRKRLGSLVRRGHLRARRSGRFVLYQAVGLRGPGPGPVASALLSPVAVEAA